MGLVLGLGLGLGLGVERQGQGSERERHLLHEDGHGDLLLSLSLTRAALLTTYYLVLTFCTRTATGTSSFSPVSRRTARTCRFSTSLGLCVVGK